MNTFAETTIEADPKVPVIRMSRDFNGTPEQLFRAHTDPALFAQWVGPSACRRAWSSGTRAPVAAGGSCPPATARSTDSAAASTRSGPTGSCRRSRSRGSPTGWRWRRLWFEDLGNGRTRLRTQSLVDSFESRDAWLASGMEVGVNEGYAKLEEMLADGTV